MFSREIQLDTHGGPVTLAPRWLRVPGAVKYSGLSRSKLYELLSDGRIRSICVRSQKGGTARSSSHWQRVDRLVHGKPPGRVKCCSYWTLSERSEHRGGRFCSRTKRLWITLSWFESMRCSFFSLNDLQKFYKTAEALCAPLCAQFLGSALGTMSASRLMLGITLLR
jgi:hypothetical protein